MSRAFQDELRFFGIRSSPNYVGQPQGNGIAERMMKTLKHQLLWLKTWDDVDQVNEALQAFRETYNNHWMVGRWGYKSPATVREELTPSRRAT
ncbi:MAG: transposase [Proteobacteria bacterium]|nr:transposase [Pseudomonadota bacterium]